MKVQLVALLCVIGLSFGQILFKLSASILSQTNNMFSFKVMLPLFAAITLYGATSIAWVWVLKYVELGRVYPLMALAFALVPIGSYFVFNERFSSQYFIGVFTIVVGIVIAVKA